ncbi:enhanced serine sensitivity protein SseB C-terminal domain-containing protein [Streptacidiphilus monticola]|jgi:hypothetical protein|uniref:Enhanced serine sensitivity protein SseB C-terminal domain-containing protein n=1 Tax=Streptacidiphilus monticola TaxID=2161674 RepID=A0ABW1FXU6_9ACTN
MTWPGNELEQVLQASVGEPGATPRVMEVLARSHVWLPLPGGPTQDGITLDLPTTELAGKPYVPVFSSEEQLHAVAGAAMSYAIAPVRELARGLPPGVGIAVNPEGTVGIPVPAEGVPDLCVGEPAQVGLREPEPEAEPGEFLGQAAGELSLLPHVLTARRALVQVEGDPEKLFVGVQLSSLQQADQEAVHLALGRALHAAPVPWPVSVVLLDVAQDTLAAWMLASVTPFYDRSERLG